MKGIRAAFITNEFVLENPSSGGLASYLNRITRALRDLGHEPEVFVQRRLANTESVIDLDGVRVEHVSPIRGVTFRLARYLERRTIRSPWDGVCGFVTAAWALGQAVERRHKAKPFDFVQSASVGASGLFVRRLPGRPHLIRLSSDRQLLFEIEGLDSIGGRLMGRLERLVLQRADAAYAPSRFLAEYCRQSRGCEIKVLRPPLFLESKPLENVPQAMRGRYLIHFGRLGAVKGSDVLARTLRLVWQREPDFRMIWAGRVTNRGDYEACHLLWGEHAANVLWVGAVEKPLLYALIKGAVASVLPSRLDNFPNTVIESLLLGVPVIGSRGASIDELVEAGVNGELVPIGDEAALAEAMLSAWRGNAAYSGKEISGGEVFRESEPRAAAQRLLELANDAR